MTIFAAGDIADCKAIAGSVKTAELLKTLILASPRSQVFTLGDHTYPLGQLREFLDCYAPTWGDETILGRTYPVPGNHDYDTPRAVGYYTFFGPRATPPDGYYAFVIEGRWLVLALNSNISADTRSPQYRWAQEVLQKNQLPCALVYWHHPVVSSGKNGDQPAMRELWEMLDAQGVDAAITAHDHLYERFAPLNANLEPASSGIRQFIVGTGGAPLYPFLVRKPGSEKQISKFGVLKLDLRANGYDWEFVAAETPPQTEDFGSGTCR